jgi:hypothetical protein
MLVRLTLLIHAAFCPAGGEGLRLSTLGGTCQEHWVLVLMRTEV